MESLNVLVDKGLERYENFGRSVTDLSFIINIWRQIASFFLFKLGVRSSAGFVFLFFFFFPVVLFMVPWLDSVLAVDYYVFFFTDEVDFDDIVPCFYMILFFFLMLPDFDSEVEDVSDVLFDYVYYSETNFLDSNRSDVVFFNTISRIVRDFSVTKNGMELMDTQVLEHSFNISKYNIHHYISNYQFVLDFSSVQRGNVFWGVDVDSDNTDMDNSYVYSLYMSLFILELVRFVVFFNNLFLFGSSDLFRFFNTTLKLNRNSIELWQK